MVTLFDLEPVQARASKGMYDSSPITELLSYQLIPVIAYLGKTNIPLNHERGLNDSNKVFFIGEYEITERLLQACGWPGYDTNEFLEEIVLYVESECSYIKRDSTKKLTRTNRHTALEYMDILLNGATWLQYLQEGKSLAEVHAALVADIPDSGVHTLKFHSIPRYILNGLHDKRWYEQVSKEVLEFFPGFEPRVLFDILAATSIRASIESNTKKFLSALKQFYAEETYQVKIKQRDQVVVIESTFRGFLDATVIILNKVKNGASLAESVDETSLQKNEARKIKNFARAMHGVKTAIPVDIWITRMFCCDSKRLFRERWVSSAPTPKLYDAIYWYMCEVARLSDVEPRQLSAMGWVGIRSETSTSLASQFGPLLKKRLNNGFFASQYHPPVLNGKYFSISSFK
ncbi:MAG TPA: hypothetical protein VGE18_01860 [Candidatus Paceibacterota bacterium]